MGTTICINNFFFAFLLDVYVVEVQIEILSCFLSASVATVRALHAYRTAPPQLPVRHLHGNSGLVLKGFFFKLKFKILFSKIK